MHSFHHSRGRIFLEVICALTISASCVGAWMDLGVPAFLPAAAASALYALVHLFDMRRRSPAFAVAVEAAGPSPDEQGDLLAYVDARAEQDPALIELVEKAAPIEEKVPVAEPEPVVAAETFDAPAPEPRPKKRRSSKKAAPVVETVPVVLAPVVEEAPVAEADPTGPPRHQEPEDHAPVTPLFEPEPFVRQQRAVFGRKAG